MQKFMNGMPASLVPGKWVKSRKSEANGTCVEALKLPQGRVALRNSTDPSGPALVFTADEMEAFLDGAKKGEFDSFASLN
ncbi:DUF397 domain-containing protein [Streptomyces lydicus]|uniref:DUF397 domain-containing protein n=1 Tax=Streptomyces lydicus TaxID=47763 RepID=UPI001013BA67|nr:DUF397 domain-containing protein [Streptomyces lydicus]MCZ1006880.1 DUF397 domain-containing protein [Streptomyces lydicus]